MAYKILATDQTETPDANILDEKWFGNFQLLCTAYGSNEAILEVRPVGTSTWIEAKYNGNVIQLEGLGEALDVTLVKDYEYRFKTAAIGAEVYIAKHGES